MRSHRIRLHFDRVLEVLRRSLPLLLLHQHARQLEACTEVVTIDRQTLLEVNLSLFVILNFLEARTKQEPAVGLVWVCLQGPLDLLDGSVVVLKLVVRFGFQE